MFQKWFRHAGRGGQEIWGQGWVTVPSSTSWGLRTTWLRRKSGGGAYQAHRIRRGCRESEHREFILFLTDGSESEHREFILFPMEGSESEDKEFILFLTDGSEREHREFILFLTDGSESEDKEFILFLMTSVWRMDYKSVSTRWPVLEKSGKWNIRRQSLLMSEEAGIVWEDGRETLHEFSKRKMRIFHQKYQHK